MKSFGSRINLILKEKGLIKKDLAKLIGVSQTTIGRVVKDTQSPSTEFVFAIAEVFPDLNTRWLLTGEGDAFMYSGVADPQVYYRNRNILVPVQAHAGYAISYPDEELNDLKEIQIPGVVGMARTFEVAGDSMSPVLESGDYVVGVPVEIDQVSTSDIYILVSRETGVTIKYLQRLGENYRCKPANPAYDHTIVPLEDVGELWRVHLRITPHLQPPRITGATDDIAQAKLRKIEAWLKGKFEDYPKG